MPEALLIGCSEHRDQEFCDLPANRDVAELARVLEKPEIGGFTVVKYVLGETAGNVRQQIESLFANRRPDDLPVLYFSCHGELDRQLRLHFVAHDTQRKLLASTAISARWVKDQMDRSRSRRVVVLLDCCYGGAFTRELTRGSADAKRIADQLGGHGRVVIAAAGSMERAHRSVFTDAVVDGLDTGAADLDGDGQVSVTELYDYVYNQVRLNRPDQTPTWSADGMQGQLYIANNPYAESPLPRVLEQALESEERWQRLWAVDGLARLLVASDKPGGQNVRRDDVWRTCAINVRTVTFERRPATDAVVITVLAAAVAGTDAPAAVAKEIDGVTRVGGARCTSFADCMKLINDHKVIDYVGPSGPLNLTDHNEPGSATFVISEIQADGTVQPTPGKLVEASAPHRRGR